MLRRGLSLRLVVKKTSTATTFAGGGNTAGAANKLAADEKFALASLEYVYEWNPPNDGATKRARDVELERKAAEAYDRYAHIADSAFAARTERLVARMSEALDACPDGALLEEATLLNSEQPPLAFRAPRLTPPLAGFAPGFGMDVPQLRVAQTEESPTLRATDALQLRAVNAADAAASAAAAMLDGGAGAGERDDAPPADAEADAAAAFPFVDAADVRAVLKDASASLEELHGAMRSTVPLTGTSGEEWEAHCALQRRAFERQRLILDIAENAELAERFAGDADFAAAERARRGLLPLAEEQAPAEFDIAVGAGDGGQARRRMPQPLPDMHYAQAPKYHPFRTD